MPRGVYERKPKAKRYVRKADLVLASHAPQQVIGWALAGLEREIDATKARLTALMAYQDEFRKQTGGVAPTPDVPVPSDIANSVPRRTYRKRRAHGRAMTDKEKLAASKRMKKRWREWRQRRETA